MPGIEKIRGHLEKKKDWIRRTRDYRQKADKIRKLKRKAKERNPDEFDFHMVRSQVGLDGVHRDLEEDEEKTEVQQLLGDIGDINYVQFHLGKEKKKIEKLKFQLHASSTVGIDAAKLKDTEKEKLRLCAELGKRMEREKELEVVLKKLELKKDLALSKKSQLKPKLVRKGDAQKASVYKWTYERKK